MEDGLQKFLEEYNISEQDFASTNLQWSDLLNIRTDFKSIRKELNLIARYTEDKLRALSAVHSIRFRIKHPDHLLAKIIRKKIEFPEREITIDNYRSLITDLIGIRAIHLFKEDWVHIHKYIEEAWDLHETPIAYIREGDSGTHIEDYRKHAFNIEPHPFGYRSIHYLIESKPSRDSYIAEIQVRTIFEEGWSEIDHTIKYPKNVGDPLLDSFLDSFNILAGNSDQMGSFVRNLKNDLLKGTAKIEMYEKLTEENQGIITSLKKRVAGTIGELNSQLRRVEEKIVLLSDAGITTQSFETILKNAQAEVARFEIILPKDPQKASDIFESAAQTLDRLDKLLEIVIENSTQGEEGEEVRTFDKKQAANFTNNVQVIADIEESIARVIQVHIPDQNESHTNIDNAVNAIKARNGFATFLVGPPYKKIKSLRAELGSNQAKARALEAAARHITDNAVKFALKTQIDSFNVQNDKLQAFILKKQSKLSLFGWFFRLFS